MNPLAVFFLIGPLIAFVTAVQFACKSRADHCGDCDHGGNLREAALTAVAFAAGAGLPF